METGRKTYLLLILSIAWALLIFYLCMVPSEDVPTFKIPHLDKAAHVGFFFVQSVLLNLLFNFQTRKSYFRIILLSTLLAFLYGGTIEILQSRFFNRTGDPYDLMADILGGFAGAMIYPTILRIYHKILRRCK